MSHKNFGLERSRRHPPARIANHTPPHSGLAAAFAALPGVALARHALARLRLGDANLAVGHEEHGAVQLRVASGLQSSKNLMGPLPGAAEVNVRLMCGEPGALGALHGVERSRDGHAIFESRRSCMNIFGFGGGVHKLMHKRWGTAKHRV